MQSRQGQIQRVGGFRRGFTLVEVIIVMALIATLMAVAAPSLSRYFGGRSLTEEARRLLALTRYAQNRAISRSEPTEVWIDPNQGTYGLMTREGYETEYEEQLLEYTIPDGLNFEISSEFLDENMQAVMLFLPDGTIDLDSLHWVILYNSREDALEVVLADTETEYILQTPPEL